MQNAPTTSNNVGKLLFSKEESLLLNELMQHNFEKQSQRKNSKR
jgi:hypothetical protein